MSLLFNAYFYILRYFYLKLYSAEYFQVDKFLFLPPSL